MGPLGFDGRITFFEMQAGLDRKPLNTYQTINANAYNPEDMMSIPTSVTAPVAEEIEFALAA